ncbi:MAG: ABC transporter substrate-binding protein [bacterium]
MKKSILIIIILFFFINKQTNAEIKIFENQQTIEKIAKKTTEYPNADNKNWLKPNYSNFYKQTTPTKIQYYTNTFLNLFGIGKTTWKSNKFKKLLKKIINFQSDKYPKNNYIIKITPNTKSNFVIFTELEGAFHSLIRDLNKLIQLKILDTNLKINSNDFFIFNGNLLGRSPFILETLTIVLKLIEKNPNNVFFIKGEYEIKNNWKNFGLKKELQMKIPRKNLEDIPLENEINDFLQLQPLAIYINDKNSIDPGFIRISYFDRNYDILDEMNFFDFLNQQSNLKIDFFDLKNSVITNKKVNIKAIINGEKRITSYKKTDGLTSKIPEKGAHAWIALSSPIKANQELYKFINDAFLILNLEKNKAPTVNFFKQNALNQDGFNKTIYDLYSQGIMPADIKTQKISKFDKKEKDLKIKSQKTELDEQKEILIGTIMDLSAELSENARYFLKGLYLRINEENNNGGINNKKIRLIHLDDKYDPQLTKKALQNLIDSGIKTLLSPMGSLTLSAMLPLAEKENINIFFPEATSPIFRKKELKNIVHFFASSQKEAVVLTKHLLKEYSPSKIAIFYKTEPFSIGALNGVKEILKKHNLIENKDWMATSHLPNSLDVSAAVKEIKNFAPDAIILLSSTLGVQSLIKELGLEFLFGKKILGISSSASSAFKTFLKDKNLKYINTQLTPNPESSDLQIVQDFRKEATSQGEAISEFTLEGYMSADIFINMIKKIKGTITNEKIMNIIENIKDYNYKGLKLNFNPETREISNEVWLEDEGKTKVYAD